MADDPKNFAAECLLRGAVAVAIRNGMEEWRERFDEAAKSPDWKTARRIFLDAVYAGVFRHFEVETACNVARGRALADEQPHNRAEVLIEDLERFALWNAEDSDTSDTSEPDEDG